MVIILSVYRCTKAFSQQARLKAHLMTHTGVKHIKCLLCEKAYSVRKSLRRHLLEKHEISPEHPQYKHCFYAMSAAEAGLHIPEGVPTNISGDPTEGKSCLCLVIENKMSVTVSMCNAVDRELCTDYIFRGKTSLVGLKSVH